MSDDDDLSAAEIWTGEAYALRTFKAEDGRLVSVTVGGNHWVDGIVRHAALCDRAGVQDPRRPVVVATG